MTCGLKDICQSEAAQCDHGLRSPLLSYSLMLVGAYPVLHLCGMIWWLNEPPICHSWSWRGVRGVNQGGCDPVLQPPLCHWPQTVQFQPDHRADLPHQLVKPQHTAAKHRALVTTDCWTHWSFLDRDGATEPPWSPVFMPPLHLTQNQMTVASCRSSVWQHAGHDKKKFA